MNTESPTRDRILDAAEKLFAAHGLDAPSLRDITTAAKVNLAAVNYHFGTKDDLICAVFDRLLAPISSRRQQLLDDVLAGSRNPSVERILEAFIRPVIEAAYFPDGLQARFVPLIGRIFSDRRDLTERIIVESILPVGLQFMKLLERVLPHLTQLDMAWRKHFTIGAMAHVVAADHLFRLLAPKQEMGTADEVVKQLVAFCAAGLRAPSVAAATRLRGAGAPKGARRA